MLNDTSNSKEIRFFASAGWNTQKEHPKDVHLKTNTDYSLSAD